MNDRYRIVIIGGGIAGCSIAYHLALRGETDVLLLDKGELTSGSTWHAAGLVTHFHTSPTIMRMRKSSIELYRRLQAESGATVGWHEVGSLRVASSRDHLRLLQRQVSTARALGLQVEIIGPSEAMKIFPYMSDKDLYGALHIPGDGWLDPSGATLELARQARLRGATIRTGERVTGMLRGLRGEVAGVQTESGAIRSEIVINAAGMWARQLGQMVGLDLPIVPLLHQHLTTRPVPGYELPPETPVLRDPARLFYLREEVRGFLIGGFEMEPKAWSAEGVAWDFTQKLLPGDWDLFGPVMEGAIERIPALEKAEIMHLTNGPEAITPDSRPLAGPVPGLPGYYLAAGLSHTGFGGGGALGAILADWIVDGDPGMDTSGLNVRRFGSIFKELNVLTERVRESYRYYYYLRYPHDENESARPLRRSPVEAQLEQFGAVFGEKNGWERANYFEPGKPARRMGAEQKTWGWGRPPFFGQAGDEHRAVRERAGLFDMSSFGKVDVKGPGALSLLQRLAANNVDRPVGTVIYTQFLNSRGGIESDLTVTRVGERHFRVVTGSAFVPADIGWIVMHLPSDGSVEMREMTDELACLGLWGPQARDILQAVTSDDVSNAALPYMRAKAIRVDGVEVLAQRVTYVGELGWELYLPVEKANDLWQRLLEAGRPHALQPCGYKALDSLRLEKGYRYWSADITPEDNPFEAGLGFAVRMEKGADFIGREALRKIQAAGLKRKLCVLTLGGEPGALYGGEAVYRDGRVIDRLRSGGWGYMVAKNIGLVYLPLELTDEGTELDVEMYGERVTACVAADVLYDPTGERLRV